MSKHTPGPWSSDQYKNGAFDVIAPTAGHDGNVLVLCSRTEYSSRAKEMHANARLIAAAPKMYSLLAMMADCGNNQALDIIKEIGNEENL